MVGVEYLAGIYLANPPAVGRPGLAIAVLVVLAVATAYGWASEKLAHR